MKKELIAWMSFFLLVSCDPRTGGIFNEKKYFISPVNHSKNLLIETDDFSGVIMDKSTIEDHNSFTPTPEEILDAEEVFKKCLFIDKVGSDSLEINADRIKAPNLYYRQYFGKINEKGQKQIWFNCFNKKLSGYFGDSNWEEREIFVNDGGNDFFQIWINLTTKDCTSFSVNGEA